jgi:hypothetical protein
MLDVSSQDLLTYIESSRKLHLSDKDIVNSLISSLTETAKDSQARLARQSTA